jgi:hypothetical protein
MKFKKNWGDSFDPFKEPKSIVFTKKWELPNTSPNHGCTPYVCFMCNGATLTKNGQFLNIKPIEKNNYVQFTICLDEQMKAHMLKVYMARIGNLIFAKNQMCF